MNQNIFLYVIIYMQIIYNNDTKFDTNKKNNLNN
jgi:hypothetical protein